MINLSSSQKQLLQSLPISWQKPLETTCARPEVERLLQYLKERQANGAVIYPTKPNIFAALRMTDFNDVKVVIVGQDPYHGPGQAHGLSFSVPKGVDQPPSLRNIFKELASDLGIDRPKNGTLIGWANQGVLLLNAILTVEAGKPASHANQGWELFTDAIIEQLLRRQTPTVLILWGAYAQKKIQHLQHLINPNHHLILKAAHPSPFSATKFLGCKHFSQANLFLDKHGLPKINWENL